MKTSLYLKNICNIRAGVLLINLFLCADAFAAMHTWTTKDGARFEAEYVREMFNKITVRLPNGTTRIIPTEELSPADVRYARSAVPPQITVNYSIQSRQKEIPEIYKMAEFLRTDDITTLLTATVRVRKQSLSPYEGKLPIEIYLIGQEVATPDYRIVGIARGQVEFTEENEGIYELQANAKTRRYLEYNNEIRGVEYVGYLVVVLDSQNKIFSSATNLRWLKDQPEKINKLRTYPEGLYFFDENCSERAVPQPKYYIDRARF